MIQINNLVDEMQVDETHSVLFELLSVALGNAKSVTFSSEKVNWKEVINISLKQGVLAVAFDAFTHLPKVYRPKGDMFFKWFGSVIAMEKQYQLYCEAIKELANITERLNLKMMVLKGLGCSLNYPKPYLRPCGDIDVFIMDYAGKHSCKQSHFFETCICKKEETQVIYENGHHSQFIFKKFLVENHSTILDIEAHKSSVWLNNLLEEQAISCKQVLVDDSLIWVPSNNFNSIHLLRHMASDFASVRISLRHVLDWSTFVSKNDVDWKFVFDVAHKTNMHYFLNVLNSICVHYLGYPAEMFLIENRNEKLEQRVLNEILNCVDAVDMPHGNLSITKKIKYGFYKSRRMWRNRWKYQIVYDEKLFDSFWWKVKYGFKHLF